MEPSIPDITATISRRAALRSGFGFGSLALAGLLGRPSLAAEADRPLAEKAPHFKPRAKRIIFLFMSGGMSQLDTFEYKPKLQADDGKFGPGGGTIAGSKFQFRQHGQTGAWVSELFPNVAKHVDKLCFLRGLYTDTPAHPQAVIQLHTGSAIASVNRPSMGSWLLYGLGTQNENLPGYVTISPPANFGGAVNYGSAFLPAHYQGTRLSDQGVLPNLQPTLSPTIQRKQLEWLQASHRRSVESATAPNGLDSVIHSYELAFRMQETLPQILDLSREPQSVRDAYGVKPGPAGSFARQCLMARRLSEAGVRFVEICHRDWDQHNNLHEGLKRNSAATDQPTAALLEDLQQRGLLEDTLVLFGSEFGRMPTAQGVDGRDHNITGYMMWLAGGGVKPGFSLGATDEYGLHAVEKRMHVNDLHATLLAFLGLDHEVLTYTYGGREFRLTDVAGEVATEIFA